jgi:hypothetical protein
MKGMIELGLKKVGSNGTNSFFFNYINSMFKKNEK